MFRLDRYLTKRLGGQTLHNLRFEDGEAYEEGK